MFAIEHFLPFVCFGCVALLLCCCFCYCNAIIKTVALPLPNTAMDDCNSNRYCWCLAKHTHRLSVIKQLASRTDVFFSPFRRTIVCSTAESRWYFSYMLFLVFFFRIGKQSTNGDLDYDFCHFFAMKIFLFIEVANWFLWNNSVLLVYNVKKCRRKTTN